MEKVIKLLPWLLFVVTASALVVIISNQGIGPDQLSKWLNNPVVIAIFVSVFVFLTVDRLKDLALRISRVEDKTSSFWNDAIREIQSVASTHAKETIYESIKDIDEIAEVIRNEMQDIIRNNPWFSTINPNELVLAVKHLEPVCTKALEMLEKSENGKNTEIVRRWIIDILNDSEVKGTANDYHNLGVLASRDLNDKLLAIQIYERYLERHDRPNPDVLSDLLQDLTGIEEFERADAVAVMLYHELMNGNKIFTNRWRPWVFLSDYYRTIGDSEKALNVLLEAKKHLVEASGKAHLYRNIASYYEAVGDTEAAERGYLDCLKMFPSHTPASLQLSRLYVSSGRLEDAKKSSRRRNEIQWSRYTFQSTLSQTRGAFYQTIK